MLISSFLKWLKRQHLVPALLQAWLLVIGNLWKIFKPSGKLTKRIDFVNVTGSYHGNMEQEGIDRRIKGWRKAIEKSLNWVEE